jgi:hypothetical protein
MSARQFKLILEVHRSGIFYSLNYEPPIRGCGGYLGVVRSGDGLFSLSHEQLEKLGSGSHLVQVDERVPGTNGTPEKMTDEEERLEKIRFGVFMEKVGCGATGAAIF